MQRIHMKHGVTSLLLVLLASACGGESAFAPLTPPASVASASSALSTDPGLWTSVPGESDFVQIEMAHNLDGSLLLFARTTGGGIRFAQQAAPNGSWSPLMTLDGNLLRDFVVTNNADGRVELFALGGDRAIYHRWQTAPNGSTWSGWAWEGGANLVDFDVVLTQDGRLQVFALGSDGAVLEKHQVCANCSFGGWSTVLSNTGLVSLHAAVSLTGRISLFGTNVPGELFVSSQGAPGAAFPGFASLAGAAISDFKVVRNPDGRLDVVVLVPRTGLYGRGQLAPDGDWGNWSYLQAAGATDFTLVVGPDGALHLFTVDGSPVRVNHAVRSTPTSAFTWLSPVGGAFASVRAERNQDGRLELISLSSAAGGAVYQTWEAQVGGAWRPLPPVPSYGSFINTPAAPYYGDSVSVSFSSRSAGCTSLTMTVDSTRIDRSGNPLSSPTRIYSRTVSGSVLSDSVSFTLNYDVDLYFTSRCNDEIPSGVTRLATNHYVVLGTTRPPTVYESTYQQILSQETVYEGAIPYSYYFGYGIPQGKLVRLTNPNYYYLSVIGPYAPNTDCYTSNSVVLAPGQATTSTQIAQLYGSSNPSLPQWVRACPNINPGGATVINVTYTYVQ